MTTEMEALDALLAQAREREAAPSPDFLARVLADAEAAAREREAPPARAARRGWLSALGGWPAMGGLAASMALGVGLGVSRPATLSALPSALVGDPVSVSIGADEDPLGFLEGGS